MTRICVLWRIDGFRKHIDCVLYQEPTRFLIRVERGEEQEVFWTFPAATLRDVQSVSDMLRTRLTDRGWRLIHTEGEQLLEHSAVA